MGATTRPRPKSPCKTRQAAYQIQGPSKIGAAGAGELLTIVNSRPRGAAAGVKKNRDT